MTVPLLLLCLLGFIVASTASVWAYQTGHVVFFLGAWSVSGGCIGAVIGWFVLQIKGPPPA